MSIKEANRLSVMRQIDKKTLTLRAASQELGLSLRQTKRVRKRYLSEGELGLILRHRGRVSPNRTPPEKRAAVLKILGSEEYEGFGPTFAKEKLQQDHGYCLSAETIRGWMTEAGLWRAKKGRRRRVHPRRARRRRFGELLQGDGSRHAWFEARGEECTLVIFVDDATSRLTAGRFCPAETTEAYQELLKEQLAKYGRPVVLYVDKHSIFKTSRKNTFVHERQTHFGRVLSELDIELICAHSPQAKGRVERAFGILQDRLVKEMRLRKINTIEEANRYLLRFVEEYNRRFGRAPANREDAHRPLRKGDNLERIFARRAVRKLSKSLNFSYGGVVYQLFPAMPNRFSQTHVTVLEMPSKRLVVQSGEREHRYARCDEIEYSKPKVLDSRELEAYRPKRMTKPGRHHPWR